MNRNIFQMYNEGCLTGTGMRSAHGGQVAQCTREGAATVTTLECIRALCDLTPCTFVACIEAAFQFLRIDTVSVAVLQSDTTCPPQPGTCSRPCPSTT